MQMKDQLVYVRAKLNMSQEALARELNVSYATVNRWEKGKTIPSKRYEVLFNDFCKQKKISITE